MERSNLPFPLLSLPDLVLVAIAKHVDYSDKLAFAGSCRKLAEAFSASSKKICKAAASSLLLNEQVVLVCAIAHSDIHHHHVEVIAAHANRSNT
jgi:hypothetical protein